MPMNIWSVASGNATPQATGFDHDGNLVAVRRVVHTTGVYEDFAHAINENHRLGWEPYIWVTRDWGHDANPVRVYRGFQIFVTDDSGSYDITYKSIQAGGSLVVYKPGVSLGQPHAIISGPQGPAGPAGPRGLAGAAGPKGDVGRKWNQGPKGDQGPAGAHDSVGETGSAGPTGDRGLKGDPSAVPGPQGPKGGPSMIPGLQGPRGVRGAPSTVPGPQGQKCDASIVPGPSGPAVGVDDDRVWLLILESLLPEHLTKINEGVERKAVCIFRVSVRPRSHEKDVILGPGSKVIKWVDRSRHGNDASQNKVQYQATCSGPVIAGYLHRLAFNGSCTYGIDSPPGKESCFITLVIRLSVTAKKADKTKHYLIGDNVVGNTDKTVSVSADQDTLFVCNCDGTFYELHNPLKADTTHLLAVEWNTGVENGSRLWLDGKRIGKFTAYIDTERQPFAWYTIVGGKHIYDTEEGFIGKLYHFGMHNNRLSDMEKFFTMGFLCDHYQIQLDVS